MDGIGDLDDYLDNDDNFVPVDIIGTFQSDAF